MENISSWISLDSFILIAQIRLPGVLIVKLTEWWPTMYIKQNSYSSKIIVDTWVLNWCHVYDAAYF